MGLFSKSSSNGEIDYNKLRNDLVDEYGAQMVTFTGAMGYSDMCDAQSASNSELLEMAKKEGFDLNRYRK